eukprot:TRINITY_DN14222_c0_g1_i1.p1 TRINITY_DN14222_c0_g1~~TRINITY_DN14222_c0_g1_i1.p1  ORF type:complete len:325 (+),score=39.09 TRINITY_DN14222_c0_g1_i1:118-1092(+)
MCIRDRPGDPVYREKHDFVSFLSTGKLQAGPTFHQRAQHAKELEERLDTISTANEKICENVEALWRMRQSWGTPDTHPQWQTGFERPKVLVCAPSRSYRSNLRMRGSTMKNYRRKLADYAFNSTTLVRKGKVRTPAQGDWSMLRGELHQVGRAPPEKISEGNELVIATNAPVVDPEVKKRVVVTEEQLRCMMSSVMLRVEDLQKSVKTIHQEVTSLDSNISPEEEELKEQLRSQQLKPTNLQADLATTKRRLKDKISEGTNSAKFVYLGDGKAKELELHNGVDRTPDDLEDRIRKPTRTLETRIVPRRDCFKMAAAKKASRSHG